jgi:hypothetical protein
VDCGCGAIALGHPAADEEQIYNRIRARSFAVRSGGMPCPSDLTRCPGSGRWGSNSGGLQLSIVSSKALYSAGDPVTILAFVKNLGLKLQTTALRPESFQTTLYDTDGSVIPVVSLDRDGLDTTGSFCCLLGSGDVLENRLRLDMRYNLAPGMYTLVVRTEVYEGSSLGPAQRALLAHLTSNAIDIEIQ